MKLATRGRRKSTTTLFPGNYFVHRNLALQVPDNGVRVAPLRHSLYNQVMRELLPWLQRQSRGNPEWNQFRGINEDNLELVEPVSITSNVSPYSWWCTNPECHKLFYGSLRSVGIVSGRCPICNQRTLVQFASIFMCPTCHAIEPVQSVNCPECKDKRSVVLSGSGGRRLEYRWRCTRHPHFELFVGKNCLRDQARMVLKPVGGRVYHPEVWSMVTPEALSSSEPNQRGTLRFMPSKAAVIDVTIARIPIANSEAYFRGTELSIKEPFINPNTGSYIGMVSRIDTDAIIISGNRQGGLDEITLHSLEHALLNAAPAVTGLIQDEFGSDVNYERGEIVIYDNVFGGSGGCQLLVSRRLDRWLQIMRELAECHQVQCEDACRGCLFLPSRLCRRVNHDLNRFAVLPLLGP
ncbi:MAG: DUF1998 domain-containing protein [Pyrinomonadaceae bacterium]